MRDLKLNSRGRMTKIERDVGAFHRCRDPTILYPAGYGSTRRVIWFHLCSLKRLQQNKKHKKTVTQSHVNHSSRSTKY